MSAEPPGAGDCFVCRKHRGEIDEPGGPVYQDELVRAAHIVLTSDMPDVYLGWLVVEPRRHAAGWADLTDAEARAVGGAVTLLSRALRDSEGAEHVYTFVLGHQVPHLHVHVVPRYPGTPKEHWGFGVDEWPDAQGVVARRSPPRARASGPTWLRRKESFRSGPPPCNGPGRHLDMNPMGAPTTDHRTEAEASPRGRGRLRKLLRRRPRIAAAVGLVAMGTLIAGLLWFEPWQLFVDRTVNEAPPTARPNPSAGPTGAVPGPATNEPMPGSSQNPASAAPGSPTSPGEVVPVVLSSGPFRSLEHDTSGSATILELSDGSRVLRLEDLRTSNGPDLIVILSDTPATEDSWGAYDDGSFLSLGELKGNIGSQNYDIPPGTDLSKYRSVVVWCRRFTVGFGAAPIQLQAA